MLRNDVNFTEYLLAVEIDEKKHASRDLIFDEKRQEALGKKLNCEFIRTNRVSVMMKIMKLVECKHLLENLRTGN